MPGASALLRSVPAGRWAVVTSSPHELALARLRLTGLPVPEVLVAAGDVAHGKPHPEPYLTAAARLGVDPGDCVVFEDAPAGIAAARAGAMRVIGLATTYGAEQISRFAEPPD